MLRTRQQPFSFLPTRFSTYVFLSLRAYTEVIKIKGWGGGQCEVAPPFGGTRNVPHSLSNFLPGLVLCTFLGHMIYTVYRNHWFCWLMWYYVECYMGLSYLSRTRNLQFFVIFAGFFFNFRRNWIFFGVFQFFFSVKKLWGWLICVGSTASGWMEGGQELFLGSLSQECYGRFLVQPRLRCLGYAFPIESGSLFFLFFC